MITIEGVSKRYGERLALDDISVVVPDGAVTGLVGPNGAGKSTLLKIIAGVVRATDGSIHVDGTPYAAATAPATVLATMLSAEWIPSHLTATSYLRYHCDVHGLATSRIDEVLDAAALHGAQPRKVRDLSLGMRQRLGIAAALLAEPRNLVLDEPINGLDPDGILWLRSLVSAAAGEGRSVLLSSHLMSELSMVADQVVMIVDGRVMRQGPLSSFMEGRERHEIYIESNDLAAALAALDAVQVRHEPHRSGAVVHGVSPEEVGRVVFGAGGHLTHLTVVRRSLEETYFDAIAADRPIGGGPR